MVDVSNNWSERQVMGVDRGFGQQLTADEPRPYPETRPSRAARQLRMGLKRLKTLHLHCKGQLPFSQK